ncbi:MAG: hypothetical protein SCABRO_00122 [Candidatus Scalindua brodae]|uniref:DUF4340 domain-containing protein n=1 Tax=Candidatus Scalindua brodae TaxID=237368 RepID=A0A0B0EM23_9BACT|nr:MAG: hypothetical protein SCABRO_00122 [Candidatus Scalindua brodae]
MVAWAIVQATFSNRTRSSIETSAYLVQGLDPSNINSISLGTGDKEVTLKRAGNRFVVVNKDNYPAESAEVNNLISTCMDIKVEELFTDNPSNHEDLGVTEDKAGSVIKFFKQNSELLVGVIIGKGKGQGSGTFVRLIPGNKVYVTLDRPWIKDQVMNYVNNNVVTVDRQNIESVTVTSSNETYTLKSENDGKGVILENLPPGKKLKANDSKNVFAALNNLKFEDVKKSSAAEAELVFDKKYICNLKDSTVYTIKIAQKDDKAYITCHTDYTDKTPVTKEQGIIETEEELKKKEAKLLAQEKVQKTSARHKNRIYEIAENDAKNLTKQLSELFEEEIKEVPEEK